MKKILLFICTLFLSICLISCDGGESGGLRGQTGRKKTLTYQYF